MNDENDIAMTVEILTLADYAQETNGKLTIVGTFNELRVADLPAFGQAYLVMRFRIKADEDKPKLFNVQLCTQDAKEKLLSFGFEVKDALEKPTSPTLSLNMVVKMDIKFEHDGDYVVLVTSDKGFLGQVPLSVVRTQPKALSN